MLDRKEIVFLKKLKYFVYLHTTGEFVCVYSH